MNEGETFDVWFRRQLVRREWSQADFAKRANLAPSTVSTWATGDRLPDPSSCRIIADTLLIDEDVVLNVAGHRSDIEPLGPDDPRRHLLAYIHRIDWTPERLAVVTGMLRSMLEVQAELRREHLDELSTPRT